MRSLGIAGFLAVAVCAFALPAQAKLITAEYNGVVDAGGYDYAGVWGAANSSLAGLPVKIVFDIDTGRGTYFYSDDGFTKVEYRYGDVAGAVLSSTITIGSTSVSWVPNYFSRTFAEEVSVDPIFRPNGFSSISQSSDRQNGSEMAELFATTAMKDMSLPFGIDAVGGAVLDPAFVSMAYGVAAVWRDGPTPGSKIYDWNFQYQITSYSIVGVPEPFTLSLFGAGVAGVAALRRRGKRG